MKKIEYDYQKKDIAEHFGDMCGTSQYYRHFMQFAVYTDGIKQLCETMECWWLLDFIVSQNVIRSVKDIAYQCWRFVVEGNKCSVYLNQNHYEDIEFTTMIDGYIDVVAVWNDKILVTALPVEG